MGLSRNPGTLGKICFSVINPLLVSKEQVCFWLSWFGIYVTGVFSVTPSKTSVSRMSEPRAGWGCVFVYLWRDKRFWNVSTIFLLLLQYCNINMMVANWGEMHPQKVVGFQPLPHTWWGEVVAPKFAQRHFGTASYIIELIEFNCATNLGFS